MRPDLHRSPNALPARQGLQWLLPALLFPFTLVFKPKVKLNRMWETGSTEAWERDKAQLLTGKV